MAVLALVCGFWGVLVLVRWYYWKNELIFWNHEIVLLTAFSYAGALSLLLAKRFHQLFEELAGKNENLDPLMSEMSRNFHRKRWLVLFPLLLSAFAISLRFYTADYLHPFRVETFEWIWLVWVYLGFFLLLNATILCGRYSEMIRVFGEASQKGWIMRKDLTRVSSFYFQIALYVSLYFVFAAFTVFSLHLIYSYSGGIWPGYVLLRQLPGIILAGKMSELQTNIYVLYEVVLLGGLHLAACIAALAYFVIPQWGVHLLLKQQKRTVLGKLEEQRIEAENAMMRNPTEPMFERYAKWSLIEERIGMLPEWPFSSEGWMGTALLIGIPSFAVILKEVFLETIIGLLTK